jgi:hypothetical protein
MGLKLSKMACQIALNILVTRHEEYKDKVPREHGLDLGRVHEHGICIERVLERAVVRAWQGVATGVEDEHALSFYDKQCIKHSILHMIVSQRPCMLKKRRENGDVHRHYLLFKGILRLCTKAPLKISITRAPKMVSYWFCLL